MTRRTSFITQPLQGIDRGQHALAFSTSLFSNLSAATPRNAEKMTMLMMEVGNSPGQVSKRVLRHEGKDQLRDAEIRYFPT